MDATRNLVKEVELDIDRVDDQLRPLISLIRPNWNRTTTVIRRFTDGVTNATFGIFQLNKVDRETIDEDQGLVVKIYGVKMNVCIDRERELSIMSKLSKLNLSNEVYLRFYNGFIMSFIPGRVCRAEDLSSMELAELIAKKMARLHSTELDRGSSQSNLCETIESLFQSIDPDHRVRRDLVDDISRIRYYLKTQIQLDCVLCHNDLLAANIIYNDERNDVSFIDFEFSSPNFWLYDIANHFGEYTDFFQIPMIDRYPSRSFQKWWLQIYLSNRSSLTNKIDQDLEQLCNDLDKLTGLSHLFWALWLFSQLNSSNRNKFDYEKYAYIRLDKYFHFRDR